VEKAVSAPIPAASGWIAGFQHNQLKISHLFSNPRGFPGSAQVPFTDEKVPTNASGLRVNLFGYLHGGVPYSILRAALQARHREIRLGELPDCGSN
jgi:hypothetical protein